MICGPLAYCFKPVLLSLGWLPHFALQLLLLPVKHILPPFALYVSQGCRSVFLDPDLIFFFLVFVLSCFTIKKSHLDSYKLILITDS